MKKTRFVLVGLALIIASVAGVVLISKITQQNTTQTLPINLPESGTSPTESQPQTLEGAPDTLFFAANAPWLSVAVSVGIIIIGIVAGTALAAWLRPQADANSTSYGLTLRLALAGMIAAGACGIVLCAIPAMLILNSPSMQARSAGASAAQGQASPITVRIEWPRQITNTETGLVLVDWNYQDYSSSGLDSALTSFMASGKPGYKPSVNATLYGDHFDIVPNDEFAGPHLLNLTRATWAWRIQADALHRGQRTLVLTIEVLWMPASGQGDPIRQTLAQPRLAVNVLDAPTAQPGLLAILSWAASAGGAALCIPWLNDVFKRRLTKVSTPPES